MRRTALVLAAASLGLTACTTDPEVWNAIAMGLEQAAADLEWENRNCYWAPPPGIPYGAAQKYCPGDWGYQPPVVVVTCAPRDRDCDGYPDRRRRDRDHDGRRDRDRA
ncbi:hypothetical protein [Brevundimonas fluminis]|jgi:hypothetical protein|uniref:hypothetical protein n=1 Tax=Brevundimonas fluminis TaxID=2487274 RepID=UPI000F6586B4|nr:hypothetical protein [Brevundimonas fluminis]